MAEERNQLRARKAALTRQMNKIRRLIAEENQEQVKAQIDELLVKFKSFESAHEEFHATLTEEKDIEDSDERFSETQGNYIAMLKEAKTWLKSYNDIQSELTKQQKGMSKSEDSSIIELLSLPKIELKKFNGDPLQYHSFMATFDETVDCIATKDKVKLTRLLQYTTGEAYDSIHSCMLMEGSAGYRQARKILNDRFGNSDLVANRLINGLLDGGLIKRADELQRFCDQLVNCSMTLRQMNRLHEVENQSYILQLSNRFQPFRKGRWTKRALEIKAKNGRYPRFEEFVEFVEEQTTEATDPIYGSSLKEGPKDKKSHASNFTSNAGNHKGLDKCVMCDDFHRLFFCAKFKSMKPPERLQFVRERRLCENCLLGNHSTSNCRKPSTCSVPGCGKRHTKFIHVNQSNPPQVSTVRLQNASANLNSDVYMPVVAVRVNGQQESCALLDTASSNSFCTRALLRAIQIQGTPITYSLTTLGKSEDVHSEVVNLHLSSLDGHDTLNISNVYVTDEIPFKSACPESGVYSHLKGLTFVSSGQDINLLIGQDNAAALMPLEVKNGKRDEPFACRTLFGWSVNGPVHVNGSISPRVTSQFICTSPIEEKVQSLWKLENDGLYDNHDASLSIEDRRVIALWDTECRFVDGKYELPIPWKPNIDIPNNLDLARCRLKSLKSNLLKRDLIDKYDSEICKLLERGYAEKVPIYEIQNSESIWYLPHHAVISSKKPDRLRVVFDCSAKFHGESLNDKCYRGPDLNNKLINVLVRFRQYEFAIQADVEAMYYQIKVPDNDRNVLRFLWFDTEGNIIHYRMTGHVFGGVWCASAATYALRRTVIDNPSVDPLIANCVNRGFYVDDWLQSASSRKDAELLMKGTVNVLKDCGFRLTKFTVNDDELKTLIPIEDRAIEVKEFDAANSKVLGIKWNVKNDEFFFEGNIVSDGKVTRRSMLSLVASCFDPLGLISPLMVGGKLLFQEATRSKIPWDEVVPLTLQDSWNCWTEMLQNLSTLCIPRCIQPIKFDDAITELHHFSDASLRAYGMCTYIRSINKDGSIFTLLLMSKGKVAPISSSTIPRLELQAAVLSAKVDKFLRSELDISLGPSYFWVDSQLALCYICNESHRFHTYVSNRVNIIREFTSPDQWFHVQGKENPADFVTRVNDLDSIDMTKWLHGPEFLSKHKSEWQIKRCELNLPVGDPEIRKDVKVCAVATLPGWCESLNKLIEHYSSWFGLKRGIAWLLRFKQYLQGIRRFNAFLTVEELHAAEFAIIKYVQHAKFHKEFNALSNGQPVNKDSSIKSLAPFIDDSGLLRVGGRLSLMTSHGVCTRPVIVPHSSPIASSIVNDSHNLAHLGVEWVVSIIRQKYWITKVRTLVKAVAKKCLTCRKLFAPVANQVMSDLPPERLTPYKRPFTFTGIDVFGPLIVKHGRSEVKRYGCIFTCLSIRAVHIERLCNLSTDSFICALRRFFARRGFPEKIYCDNGTNFVGACAELKKSLKQLNKSVIQFECLKNDIEWHFNPPTASHMGGVWERLIRVIRKVLAGLLNIGCRISDETLETVLAEVESIINGRPITKVSDDPLDESALTPNHLLLIGSGHTYSPGVFNAGDVYKKKWRFVQHLVEVFWKRWLRLYIPELQKRSKWLFPQRDFLVGDLVLIAGQNTPRNIWPMGLILEVYVSSDGHVRSAKIRTKSTTLVRPIHKLVLLECAS